MRKAFLIFILLIFQSYLLIGQSSAHDFPAMRWTTNAGLNHNNVDNLAVDSKGVIWVSTIEGLYRHHGHTFENINTILENSPFDNPIRAYDLYIDKQDRLWIGTWENGLMMYDIGKNVMHQFESLINEKDHLSQLRIYGLHTVNDSIFRFTSHTHGLIDYNLNQDKFELLEVFTDSTALALRDGFQLMLKPLHNADSERVENWYISLTGIVQYLPEADTFLYHDDGDQIELRDAILDNDSIVWGVTYGQGLYSFDMRNKEFVNYRCVEGVDWSHGCLTGGTIEIYNDSLLIIGTTDGLYYFNKKNHTFSRFYDFIPHSLWSGITSEMKWIDGDLWQASWSSTLYRHYRDDHGVKSVSAKSRVDGVHYDKTNKRFISVSAPNLITFHSDDEYSEVLVPKELLGQGFVEGVSYDLEGRLWVAANYQVMLYDEQNKTFSLPFKKLLSRYRPELTFNKIGTNPNGKIWLGSHDGTIFTFDPKTLDYQFYGGITHESTPLEYSYRAHLEGFTADGYTWFSAQNGFFGLSPDDKPHYFAKDLKNGKTRQPITLLSPSMGIGANRKICFGAKTHEVYIVDRDSISCGFAQPIDLSNHVPNLSINDIEIDDKGVIWIATKMGLILVDLKNDIIKSYGDTHRLFDLEEIELKDGINPVVTSRNNFLIIHPDQLSPLTGKPNIQLLDAELDSKLILNDDESKLETGARINLGPNDNFIRIRFNDFNYVSQKPKTYAIKIEGVHEDWIDLKERTEFGFSGLPGGLSKVMVKSKLQFAKEYSEPVNLLNVHVTPPLMQRKEFWAFCAAILLLLFYLGYRYRLSQLKEKQNLLIAFNKQLAETEMKALRAQMNPHFLFNVLNAIKLNVQKNEQENAIDFITDFSKLIRAVLQNSGKQRISLAEELQTLDLYIKIERKRFSTSFDYEFTTDENIDIEQITIPPMLLQPYVENAIWHGILHKSEGHGTIKVNTYKKDNSIIVEITDNGIGREKANQLKLKSAQRNKSMGMQITQDRMAISNMVSNDHIEVEIFDLYGESGQSEGTRVVITLNQN